MFNDVDDIELDELSVLSNVKLFDDQILTVADCAAFALSVMWVIH